jgi:propionyl-CoA carboxylase beta chain
VKRPKKIFTEEDRKAQASCNILNHIIPLDPNKPYDMKIVIETILDKGEYYEIMPDYAKNILCGFGDVEGQVVGVVGN